MRAPAWRSALRRYLVDSLAALAVFTLIAAFAEFLIAGPSPLTGAGVPPRHGAGAPAGRPSVRPLARPDLPAARRGRGRRARGRHTAAPRLPGPLYAAILLLAGAKPQQMAAALGSAVVAMVLLGRPYGLVLERVRRRAGVAPAEPG